MNLKKTIIIVVSTLVILGIAIFLIKQSTEAKEITAKDINYTISDVTDDKLTIHLYSDVIVKKVIFPNQDSHDYDQVALDVDYDVNQNGTYFFKIYLNDDTEIIKAVLITSFSN